MAETIRCTIEDITPSEKIRIYDALHQAGLTNDELKSFAENASILRTVGWGRITVVWAGVHKKIIEVTTSQKL